VKSVATLDVLADQLLLREALEARPAIAKQMGESAYEELLDIVTHLGDRRRVNSIWAATLYPVVLEALWRECPDLRRAIGRARQVVQAGEYQGPRDFGSRTIPCPYCGDTATVTGQFTAACWSCGTIHPPRQR
jgi:hypothetical protein